MMELVICLMIFGLVFSIILAVIRLLARHDIYQARLNSINTVNKPDAPRKHDWRRPLQVLLKSFSRLFASRSFTEKIQARLIRAGIPLKGEEYISFCLLLNLLLPLLLYILTANLWLAVVALTLGACSPQIFLEYKKEKRLGSFEQQLGDALVVIANALRAGFGFQQAMDTVRKEMPAPIADEFSWTLREINLGFSHEEALQNLGSRVQSQDLDMVISGIIIQKQVGGNLAEILDNISEMIRERARIKKEIKILTAQGRLSGLIIGLLPAILIAAMLVINPAYFNIMLSDIRGLVVLITGFVFEILGLLVINRIVDIEF